MQGRWNRRGGFRQRGLLEKCKEFHVASKLER